MDQTLSICAVGQENNTQGFTQVDAYERGTVMESDGHIHPEDHDAHNHAQDGENLPASRQGDFLEGAGFFQRYEDTKAGDYYRADVLCESWPLDDLLYDGQGVALGENTALIPLEDKHGLLSWACGVLDASPTARKMLSEAAEQGWSLALEHLGGHDFHIDVPQKLIVLDDNGLLLSALGRSEYFRNGLLVSLTRALRDVWQEKRHGAFDETYGPEAVLYLERVRTADLDVLAVLVGWELRSEGFGTLWRHLIGSEEGDLAMRFSGHLERDPSSAYNGKALQAAFVQWFREQSRVDACDHETLNGLDVVLMNCPGPEVFGNKKLTPVGIEVLSCLPDRTAYLQGFGDEILRSPAFSGLGDIVNQAHLMQILHDMKAVRVQGIPFRSESLAAKIFPNGQFIED